MIRHIHFKLLLLSLSVFLQATVFSQQIPTINLVVKDGLSSYYVTDITQDKAGFMWFATKYGLSRYDGDKFTVYIKKPNEEILNSNDIYRVEADTIQNRVWIGNRWSGINVFDCETELFLSFLHDANDPASLISNEIKDILVTTKGDVWIATDKGLDKYDAVNGQFIHYNSSTFAGFPPEGVNTLAEGTHGRLYLGHIHGGFSILSPEEKQIRNFKHISGNNNSLANNMVHSIFTDADARVWIATDRGLSILEPSTDTFRNFKDAKGLHHSVVETVNSIHQTSDGRIWAGTYCDLCYFDVKDIEKIFSGEKDVNHMFIQDLHWGISNPSVYCVFEDSYQNVWIASNGGGASFISRTSSFFNSWRIDKIPGVVNGLNDKEVLTICVDKDDNVWMGTDGGGINVNRNGRNGEYYSSATGEVSCVIYHSSLKDSNNDLWFGGINLEIDIFKAEGGVAHYKAEGNSSSVFCLFEDDQKNIWIATDNGLEIYNLETKEKTFLHKENSGLPTNAIRSVSQDKAGNIWIGTLNKGITVFNPFNKEMTHLNEDTPFHYNQINQLFRDSKDNMWVAMTEGLALFPEGRLDQYQLYDSKKGLASNQVCAIEEDEEGNIWVSTNQGISCFLVGEERFLNYDHTEGALFGTYMAHSVAKTKDGTIYFGSINGVCYFNPKDRPVNVILPPVMFTEFRVHNRNPHEDAIDTSCPMGKNMVSLTYDQNIFSVSFNVMDKSLQGKVEYAYMLEGLTDAWVNTDGDNLVTFRNIPPHTYKLHIKARYKNQAWQENYSTLTIQIHPPLWQTWWAKCFYIVCFVLFLLFVIRSYKRRLQLRNSLVLEKEKTKKQQELNEERLRFYTNITHELKTPLTLILGPLEDLQSDPKVQYEHKDQLSLIHKNSIRLLNLVTQILEFRKTETQNKKLCVAQGDISASIQEMALKYKELSRNKEIDFGVRIETDKTQLYFDQEVISMIIDNLISNAFKYTNKGVITLTLRSVVADGIDYTEIEVSDTGIGIPEEDLSRIFDRYYQASKKRNVPGFGIGLALVKNLVELHEGSISVDSKPEVGSSFCVRLITHNSYPDAIHIAPVVKAEEIDEEQLNKPIVLVVEDENDIRDYIANALMNTYEIVVAENGEQGFQMALESIPDLIVSDIIMPVMDGVELCRQVKAHVATSHIPVILLTAKDSLQDKTEGYTAGADSYIIKPFSAFLLKSRIANLLDARKKIASQISSNASLKLSIIKDSLNKIDNEFIEKIVKVVEDNLTEEKIDMPTIAQELSMSYSSLYRKVKALTGVSTGEFIRKIRMRKAEQLLLSGKYNISEIAFQVGLNSVSYFRECFKEEFGLSPSEYIKKIKEEKGLEDGK